MFCPTKISTQEIVKWGVITGVLESALIFCAAMVWDRRQEFFPSVGWESLASLILLGLVSISCIGVTGLVVSHPCWLMAKGRGKDAALTTLIVGLIIILAILLIISLNRFLI
ncbi:hypothetical protein HY224_03505 [Candidatus Uhrbacteria bacterium]|nr:hypothetical protein [Candidatus Uhrbacteria bacterium]